MAIEAVQEAPSGTVTAVPTTVPAIQLDPQIAQVVATVETVAKTVSALATLGGRGGGNVWNVTSNLLALAALGVSLAHMTMGGQAMDDRLDRIELVLTHMAKKLDPDMVDFIEK